MDASLATERLIEEFHELIAEEDLDGAEELLSAALGYVPERDAFLHFQLARLYQQWNKLTSCLHHLNRALDLSAPADGWLRLQILEDIRQVRRQQVLQKP